MSIKILATADLHLGKSSADVSGNFTTTKNTWKAIVKLAIKENVDVVVLCGDIIDRDNRYFEAIGPLENGLEELGNNGIEVFMISGNHDYDVLPNILSNLNKRGFSNFHLLGANGTWELKTHTTKLGEKIQFIGWSFPDVFVHKSSMNSFKPLSYDPEIAVIGLLHGDVGVPESNYNPISREELINQEVDLWILGHIHKPNLLNDYSPLVRYTGSPHALSAKEPYGHGPWLFTIEGKKVISKHILLSPVRYEPLEVDIKDCGNVTELRDEIMNKLRSDANSKLEELENVSALVYQVKITGRHAQLKQVEKWTTDIASNITDLNLPLGNEKELSVRKLTCTVKTEISDLTQLALQNSLIGQLAETILAVENNTQTVFLDELIMDWIKKARSLNNTTTYRPLSGGKNIEGHEDIVVARDYILRECYRLLGELIDQKNIA